MNTLPRAITAQLFPNPQAYLALRYHWSQLVNSDRKHTLTAGHHLLYLALQGKDWRRAFTPPTNPRQLANGAFYNWGLWRALRTLSDPAYETELLTPFEGLVTLPMLQTIRRLVGKPNLFAFAQAGISPGHFPFEAYPMTLEAIAHA